VEHLVFGLLQNPLPFWSREVASKLRNLTLSWSRYDYHRRIIEETSIDRILMEALESGYKYCFIQSYGHIISEHWYPEEQKGISLLTALEHWIEETDFFVTGHILHQNGVYGLDEKCLLVDLEDYREWDCPAFNPQCPEPVEVIRPVDRSRGLFPTDQVNMTRPQLPGWNFIRESLERQKPVYRFNEDIRHLTLNLVSREPTPGFTHYLTQGLADFSAQGEEHLLTEDQTKFLTLVDLQFKNAPHGVFLWNLEPYDDIASPAQGFQPPLTSLYSVAAGFKPNRILFTHGFDEKTRVVFFDYSLKALEVKRVLHEEWDGEDFPRFVKYLFRKFPYPETYYQLWKDVTPENLDWRDIDRMWLQELEKWGGEDVFRQHWKEYKKLKHLYIHCNILTDPGPLIDCIEPEPNAVIWWSNAFFTMYSNWHYPVDERKQYFEDWINKLAQKNPHLLVNGSDYNNTGINHISVQQYLQHCQMLNPDYLNPVPFHKVEIRY
jgi:hypothetical protein